MGVQVTYQLVFLVFTLPLFISNLFDNHKKDRANILINRVFVCIILKLILTILGFLFDGNIELVFFSSIFTAGEFGMGIPAVFFFTEYVIEMSQTQSASIKRLMLFIKLYCSMLIAIDVLSIFFPLIFFFEDGYYMTGPLFYMYNTLFLGTLIIASIIIYNCRRGLNKRHFWFMQIYLAAPIMGLLFQILVVTDFDFVNFSTALALVIIYVTVHIDKGRQLAIREKELTDTKVALMISQIQPHFLYNALTAISMLCDTNAKKAQLATDEFSDYLRGNLEALSHKKPIPFYKELSHVKAYLYLEQIRFGEQLHVVYDIEEEDFFVPALSLQPLVENAVKHGLSKKDGGGTVTIKTVEQDEFYQIVVTDDGIGFDPNEKPSDGKLHIGIDNVKSRLQTMLNASVKITSEKGKGTTVIVNIPK